MSPWQWHAMAVDTSQGRTCSTRPTLVETNDTNSSSKHLETLGWRLDQLWMIYGIPLVTIGLVVRYPMEYGYHDLYGEIWWVKLALLTIGDPSSSLNDLSTCLCGHVQCQCQWPHWREARTHTHIYTHTNFVIVKSCQTNDDDNLICSICMHLHALALMCV